MLTKMKYSNFVQTMNTQQPSNMVAMRDESDFVGKTLIPDVSEPEFWKDVNDLSGIVLLQG